MEEITLWYRWVNKKEGDYWEYITYTKGWTDEKFYKPKTPFPKPYRFAKEFAYMVGNSIINACD